MPKEKRETPKARFRCKKCGGDSTGAIRDAIKDGPGHYEVDCPNPKCDATHAVHQS